MIYQGSERRQRQSSHRSRLQIHPSSERSGLGSLLARPVAIQRQLSVSARTESLERQLQRMRSRFQNTDRSANQTAGGSPQPQAADDASNIDSVSQLLREDELDLAFSEVVAQATAEADEDLVGPFYGEPQEDSADAEFQEELGQAAMAGQDRGDFPDDDQPATAAQRQELQRLIDVTGRHVYGGDIIIAQGAGPHRSHSPGGTSATTSAHLRALLRAPRSLDADLRDEAGREDGSEDEDDSEADYNMGGPSYIERPHDRSHERCHRYVPGADLDMVDPLKATRPQECQFLRAGARFQGNQSISRAGLPADDWTVALTVDHCDWGSGYLCGTMTAKNVPHSSLPVTTFFEGEIVGAGAHTFASKGLDTDREEDLSHWLKFPVFRSLQLGDSSSNWGRPSVDIESYLDDMPHGHGDVSEVSARGHADTLDEAAELVLARMQRNSMMPVATNSTHPRPSAINFLSGYTASASSGGRRAPTLERPCRGGASQPPSEKVAPEDVVFLRIKEKAFLGVDQERRGLTIAGLYYCCLTMDKDGGAALEGYYHDSRGQPFQRLLLNAVQDRDPSCTSFLFR